MVLDATKAQRAPMLSQLPAAAAIMSEAKVERPVDGSDGVVASRKGKTERSPLDEPSGPLKAKRTDDSPSDAQLDAAIQAIRDAYAHKTAVFTQLNEADVPPRVLAKLKTERAKRPDGAEVVRVTVGDKTYYDLHDLTKDDPGSGQILDASGNKVTGYGFAPGEGPFWESTPSENKAERALAVTLNDTLTRSKLGTKALKSIEVTADALPSGVAEQVSHLNTKDELHFYKVQSGGETFYAVSIKLPNGDADFWGFVNVYDSTGRSWGNVHVHREETLNFEIHRDNSVKI
jgi:hypothetical protein